MLDNELTLGVDATALTYVKRFPDANRAVYSVANLAANAARTATVSHQPSSNGAVRTMFSLDNIDVVSGSTEGKTEQARLYIVLQRPAGQGLAECLAMFARLKTVVSDTALLQQLLNQEV